MTRIIIVRHGNVDWIEPPRFRGRADLPLSALGRRQIAAAAERIRATAKPSVIYSSPMSRCVDTGKAIGALLGLEPQIVDDLNDVDYGEWQGSTWEEVQTRWPEEFDTWLHRPLFATFPSGENLPGVQARLLVALAEIVRRHREDAVVLVAHDSINRIILLNALGLSLSSYWQILQDPCAINEVDYADGVFAIRSINETGHLADV